MRARRAADHARRAHGLERKGGPADDRPRCRRRGAPRHDVPAGIAHRSSGRRRATADGAAPCPSRCRRVMLDSPALPIAGEHAGRRAADFLALCKPRVVAMVLVTTAVGYYLGGTAAPVDYARFLSTLVGTALAAGGTLALNQYMERDRDALMHRTRDRPLPDGRLAPIDALLFGSVTTAVGLVYLALVVDALPALVTALTTATYLFA